MKTYTTTIKASPKLIKALEKWSEENKKRAEKIRERFNNGELDEVLKKLK